MQNPCFLLLAGILIEQPAEINPDMNVPNLARRSASPNADSPANHPLVRLHALPRQAEQSSYWMGSA